MTPADIEALSSAWLAARLENEAHTARIAALEARVTELEEGLGDLYRAATAYHDAASPYFNDADFDRDGCLANVDAELWVAALPSARALIGEKP